MPTILLDMDEVVVQCVAALLKLHGCEDRIATWPKGQYRIEQVCGMDAATFWKRARRAAWNRCSEARAARSAASPRRESLPNQGNFWLSAMRCCWGPNAVSTALK